MGRAIANLDATTVKGSSSILYLSEKATKRGEASACIRCGRCADACPMGLEPFLLNRLSKAADMEGLEKAAVEKKEARKNIMGYKLPNGKWVNVIAEGRLVNIAAADGHPAEIMDMSFAVQAMAALYIRENHEKLGNHLINIPEEMDNIIASRKLAAWGIEIDKLTPEQEKYLNSWKI